MNKVPELLLEVKLRFNVELEMFVLYPSDTDVTSDVELGATVSILLTGKPFDVAPKVALLPAVEVVRHVVLGEAEVLLENMVVNGDDTCAETKTLLRDDGTAVVYAADTLLLLPKELGCDVKLGMIVLTLLDADMFTAAVLESNCGATLVGLNDAFPETELPCPAELSGVETLYACTELRPMVISLSAVELYCVVLFDTDTNGLLVPLFCTADVLRCVYCAGTVD